MAHPVTHFEINAKDAAAARSFYGELFGWRIDTNNPGGYGIIDTRVAGRGIGGGIGESQTGRSMLTFYVETPDLDASLAKAQRLGGSVIVPPTAMGPVSIALFADPEGNVVGLATSPAPAPRKRTVAKKAAKKVVKKAVKKTVARAATARKRALRPRRRA